MERREFQGETINLKNRNIGDDGCIDVVRMITAAIQSNRQISAIHLEGNGITDRGIFYLTELVQFPLDLCIGNNNFTYDALKLLYLKIKERKIKGFEHARLELGTIDTIKLGFLLFEEELLGLTDHQSKFD